MRINNNEPSFKAVTITPAAMKVLSERMPAGEFSFEIDKFKDLYKNSPIKLNIDIFDSQRPRLDATIYKLLPGQEDCVHIMESKLSYFFNLNPEKFLKRAGKELEKMEKQLGLK